MAFELPPLPYDYAALEPIIDKQTMTLHHDMHHGAYVKNLNAAIEKHPELGKKSAEDLIRDLNSIPDDIRGAVRNNGGGHVNHSMFWKIMKPKGGGDPNGPIAQAITKTFGNFKDFQTKFNDAGVKQFGSGWVWLAGKGSDIQILSTPNQGGGTWSTGTKSTSATKPSRPANRSKRQPWRTANETVWGRTRGDGRTRPSRERSERKRQ